MADHPRFFDDLAGVAGGAFSALNGIREEIESQIRARVNEAIRHLELVRRDELDAVAEMASNARAGQEDAERRLLLAENRVSALEKEVARLSAAPDSKPDSKADAADLSAPVSSSAAAPATKPPMHEHGHSYGGAAGPASPGDKPGLAERSSAAAPGTLPPEGTP